MVRILVFLISSIFFLPSAFAGDTAPFFDLVQLKRDVDGQLYEVMIRPRLPSRAVEIIRADLINSVKEQQQIGVVMNPIPMGSEKFPGERELNEYRKIVEKILRKLQSLDLEDIFKNASLKNLLDEFQTRLVESTRDFQVIARPNDPNYFHSNKVMKELLKWGLDEAIKELSGPVASIASYIISETIRTLIERRTYYQKFVAHYLLSYSPEELGLTNQEVAWVKSSIHESYVAWDKPWDSWEIEDQWDTYGTQKYDSVGRTAWKNLIREEDKFDSFGELYNFSFVPVVEDGVRKIKNLVNSKSKYDKSLATAFNYDRPCEQIGFRIVLRLVEMGISQVSIPSLVKKPFRKFIRSFYGPQTTQEGFLTAYMMSNNMPEAKYILLQGFNPLVILDHKWDADGNHRYDGLTCNF